MKFVTSLLVIFFSFRPSLSLVVPKSLVVYKNSQVQNPHDNYSSRSHEINYFSSTTKANKFLWSGRMNDDYVRSRLSRTTTTSTVLTMVTLPLETDNDLVPSITTRNLHEKVSQPIKIEVENTFQGIEIESSSHDIKIESISQETEVDTSRPMKLNDAISLIAGTAVGGGFLALPSFTSPIGWLPTTLGLSLAYGFLVLSAIAYIEAAGLMKEDQEYEQGATGGGPITTGTSIASVIKHAFGGTWAIIAGLGFLAQMFVITTAQVVKTAEILSYMTGWNYKISCALPVFAIASFVYSAKPETVERTNLILTCVMIGGFTSLVLNTFLVKSPSAIVTGLFQKSDWLRLLPNTKVAFAMPIFIKLLAFGEAIPLSVERMVFASKDSSSTSIEEAETDGMRLKSDGKPTATTMVTGKTSMVKGFHQARTAAVIGALLPLLLAILWSGTAAALIDPSDPNPIFFLLGNYGSNIAVPVLLLSGGATGTTLFSSFLAIRHFMNDMIYSKFGYCDKKWSSIINSFVVVVPCILACIGPSIYIPLLAFAGAYPTTLLYGLAPSLAALTLRHRLMKKKLSKSMALATPKLVPGGKKMLTALVLTSIGLVGASTALALKRLLPF